MRAITWSVLLFLVVAFVLDGRRVSRAESKNRSRRLRNKCVILVSIDRAQTISGQAFADVDDIMCVGSILDFDGVPPAVEDHPRWWVRRQS